MHTCGHLCDSEWIVKWTTFQSKLRNELWSELQSELRSESWFKVSHEVRKLHPTYICKLVCMICLIIGVCTTPMWSMGQFCRNPKIAHFWWFYVIQSEFQSELSGITRWITCRFVKWSESWSELWGESRSKLQGELQSESWSKANHTDMAITNNIRWTVYFAICSVEKSELVGIVCVILLPSWENFFHVQIINRCLVLTVIR